MSGNKIEGRVCWIIETIRRSPRSPLVLCLEALEGIILKIIVLVFGRLAYDASYLRGRWFEHPWSPGWHWAFNGMIRKLFTGHGRGVPWPVGPGCDCGRDVEFSPDELNNFQISAYYQTFNGSKISLGRNVWVARGCCLITTNHDLLNPSEHQSGGDIRIGDHCWLGANAVILPGVELGPHTVVGANAVVTKSYLDGNVVLAGVPAKPVRSLDFEGDYDA